MQCAIKLHPECFRRNKQTNKTNNDQCDWLVFVSMITSTWYLLWKEWGNYNSPFILPWRTDVVPLFFLRIQIQRQRKTWTLSLWLMVFFFFKFNIRNLWDISFERAGEWRRMGKETSEGWLGKWGKLREFCVIEAKGRRGHVKWSLLWEQFQWISLVEGESQWVET